MAVRMIVEYRNPRRVREARKRAKAREEARRREERDQMWESSLDRLHEIILRDRPRGGTW